MRQTQRNLYRIGWDLSPWCFCLLLGCGSWSDAGTGNKVLEVTGSLEYDATADNPACKLQLVVRRNGVLVPTAQIKITDGDNKQSWPVPYSDLLEDSYYLGDLPWIFRLQLNVQDGADNLSARLEGPTPHSILKPLAGARLLRKNGLEVAWRSENGAKAEEVTISLKNAKYSYRLKEDRGAHMVAGNTLVLGGDEITVSRTNRLILIGGAGNSTLQTTYRAATRFVTLEED